MSLKIRISKFLDKTNITELFTLKNEKKIIILMYHHVIKEKFEEQIKYLKSKEYNIISEKDLYDYLYNSKEIKKKSVLITFDDGYKNTYDVAYPILKKYKYTGLVFLPTELISKKEISWYDLIEYRLKNKVKIEKEIQKIFFMKNDERISYLKKYKQPKKVPQKFKFMSWSDVQKASDVFSYGNHTHSHPIVSRVKDLEEELEVSNKLIKKVQKKVYSFAYPLGIYTEKEVEIVNKHFPLAFSAKFGTNTIKTNKHTLCRIGIPPNEDISVFKLKMSSLRKIFEYFKPKRFKNGS